MSEPLESREVRSSEYSELLNRLEELAKQVGVLEKENEHLRVACRSLEEARGARSLLTQLENEANLQLRAWRPRFEELRRKKDKTEAEKVESNLVAHLVLFMMHLERSIGALEKSGAGP